MSEQLEPTALPKASPSATASDSGKPDAGKPDGSKPAPRKPSGPAAVKSDFRNPQYYINRELSWIDFNERVLEEAEDPANPLLERLKFLVIFSTNLDEFFMIRVSGLMEQLSGGVVELAPDGLTPQEQLREINERLRPLMERHGRHLVDQIIPKLARKGIVIHPFRSLSEEERARLHTYFLQEALPVLTPLAIDPGHPFPHVLNRTLNLAFVVRDPRKHVHEKEFHFAVVQVPGVLGRFIKVYSEKAGDHFVLLEEVIAAYASALFPGLDVKSSYTFRVLRDADIEVTEDEAEDLLTMMEEQVRRRKWGEAVRLDVSSNMPQYVRDILMESLELEPTDVYETPGPRNLTDFMALYRLDYRDLKDKPFNSYMLESFRDEERSVFSVIRSKDILLHHPYDSFTNVADFVRAAARDPKVLAIKQTLYRAGGDSPIVQSLIEAAENGKQVTALVELKARFDEENNIVWAKRLEQAGVHVVYGLIGLKTHCKIAMIVRRDDTGLPRIYMHLGTGNYNTVTSRIYTDVSLITANPDFGADAINLFNYLTGYGSSIEWRKLIMAPLTLRSRVLELINREAERHTPQQPGHIIAKLNAIVDEEVIRALYSASQKGVKIDLLVRGICCLRPGLEGVSDNIRVVSVVGRFLEHSRILYFHNRGEEEIYLSSADWMPRNLNRRVELMFPVEDGDNRARLKGILETYLNDTVKARQLGSDGVYRRKENPGGGAISAQEEFIAQIRQSDPATEGAPRPKRSNKQHANLVGKKN
ncbi:MAG: polyphosphate kinase 1 [Candidatus Kapabacteria bacterium]|nr:polyphosphate kinase 1 [Candidatus Kapabacteria bacterium]